MQPIQDLRQVAVRSVAAGRTFLSVRTALATIGMVLMCLTFHAGPSAHANEAASDGVHSAGEDLPGARTDWPMWRYDASRSAATPLELPEELHLQWVRELPEPERAWGYQADDKGNLDFDVSYSPVVMGDLIFVPSNATDSVTAYRIEDGRERWRFYADGPVRFAPVAWNHRVYFVSDDGHLYCVDAETGAFHWRFRGGPSDHRLLGNERIIDVWPARGGPVIENGTIYFAAGVWPMHGVFIYALDAESGKVEWVNDTTGSDVVPGYKLGGSGDIGAIAPQGYLAASGNRLVVSGGRSLPIFLNRRTGEVDRSRGAYVVDARTAARPLGGYAVHAVDGGGVGRKRNAMLARRVDALSDQIRGEVFEKLAARDRLFVVTKDGSLFCFGPEKVEPQRHAYDPAPLRSGEPTWVEVADGLLDRLGESEGYALVLGAGSGNLLRELLARSELHIVVVEADADRVRALRDELTAAGMYGLRAAVIEAEPATFSVQPYLFRLVVSEDAADMGAEPAVFANVLNLLRPYSGLAWLGASEQDLPGLREAATTANVGQVSVEARSGHLFAKRGGPLRGAGQWTHQYHDPAQTLLSRDRRVRLPLGVLWFGGPTHQNVAARHSYSPRPHVVRGRLVFLGDHSISARDVYTGRPLWEQTFENVGYPWQTTGTYRLGAAHIGSPFVTMPDSIYLRYEGRIYRLDPATGATLDTFQPPGRTVQEIYDDPRLAAYLNWGHLSVQGDYLITTSEPHLFEDQDLGRLHSLTGTSSRRLVVMDRHDGTVLWQRAAQAGFRHTAMVSAGDTLYVIDGLSDNALNRLARRGQTPQEPSRIMALDLDSGEERWTSESKVFGTFLLYSEEHAILIEGGSIDGNFHHSRQLEDEPDGIAARRGSDGEIVWRANHFELPAAIRGAMLIPGRPRGGPARSVLTGEPWSRETVPGTKTLWQYRRSNIACDLFNASENLLLFRSGYAGFFDLEHDSGTGQFSGFRSGCTSNMIAADGVLNAPDYTRTCRCAYPLQTSLALIHMPDDSNLEFWTRYDASPPDPANHGLNFGAPGRRVDRTGRVWHHASGTHRRHASAIEDPGGGIRWVAASAREIENNEPMVIENLLDAKYTVRLHFAELDEGVGPGRRVFDVLIDSRKVLRGYDIVAAAGGSLRGTVQEFSVDADGEMTVEFRQSESSALAPLISGIEIFAKEGASATTAAARED